MSEITLPEPTHPEPPRRNPWTVWGTMASAMLHVGLENLDDLKADMAAALERYRAIA